VCTSINIWRGKYLTWNSHINKILKSCMATLRSLKQLKRSTSINLRKSLVLSKIDYCTVVFEMPPNFAIKRLQKIERSAASLVFNRYCGDNEILALNSLAVKERISLSLVKLAHKSSYVSEQLADVPWALFKQSRERLRLHTDSSRLLDVETGNICGTFCYKARKRFNDLLINV